MQPNGRAQRNAADIIVICSTCTVLPVPVNNCALPQEPVNNYMYCDVHGEYGYRLRGKIPIRSNDAASWCVRSPFPFPPSSCTVIARISPLQLSTSVEELELWL